MVRSSLMAGVVMIGRAIGRRGEVYNCLGLAALVILVIWPTSLLTLSFQLSFGATPPSSVCTDPYDAVCPDPGLTRRISSASGSSRQPVSRSPRKSVRGP